MKRSTGDPLELIRKLALSFPGVEEGLSYGTPAFRVARKLFLRLHDKEEAFVVLLDSEQQQQDLIAKDPDSFYITDHYKGYGAVLVKSTIGESKLRPIVERAWRRVARKRDIAAYEE